MAYTGTGTEEDPYCVNILTDFLDCIKKTDAYVKVIADIDAASDPSYTGELTNCLEIACKHIYADEQKSIKGITVYAANFINVTTRENIQIENLSFVDCEHKRTSFNQTIYASYGTKTFVNCKFSMKTVGYYGFFSSDCIKFTNCAGNLTYVAATTAYPFSSSTFENCNFTLYDLQLIKTNQPLIATAAAKSGFILVNPKISNIGSGSFSLYKATNEHCYVVLIDPEVDADVTVELTQLGSASNTSLIAIQNKPENLTVSSRLVEVTPDQLKSKDYLASIGFFP